MATILKKPMSEKAFKILCFSLFFLYMLGQILLPYDSDLAFLVATGRDIMQNGLSDQNVFIIDSDIHFVIQQWLYTVILAFADSFGPIGMSVFISLQLVLFAFLSWQLVKKHNVTKGVFCLAFFFICLFNGYTSNLRPQNITLILLLAECLALERFRDTKKWQWLMILPAVMILEMNLHMAMWPIHYAILLAYMVPGFYCKKLVKNDLWEQRKPVVLFTGLMTGCLFLNPYGIDGILFSVRSMTSGMQKYTNVQEHALTPFLSAYGAALILLSIVCVLLILFGKISSVSLHLSLGFGFMTMLQLHNSMFLSIALVFVICDIGDTIHDRNLRLDWQKDLYNYYYIILFVAISIGVMADSFLLFHVVDTKYDYLMACENDGMYAATSYLDDNADKDSRIFAGYVLGNYLEYRGYNNLYIDARPESYTKKVNGSKDILRDYGRYCMYGIDPDAIYDIIDHDVVQNWLDQYDFDYLLFDVSGSGESMFLRGYVIGDTEHYRRVDYSAYEYVTDSMFKGSNDTNNLLVDVYERIR